MHKIRLCKFFNEGSCSHEWHDGPTGTAVQVASSMDIYSHILMLGVPLSNVRAQHRTNSTRYGTDPPHRQEQESQFDGQVQELYKYRQ